MSTTLLSPSVEVTVADNSAYTSSGTGTVPFILIATTEDKLNTSNVTAAYTTSANAGSLFEITSQRELVSYFGQPNFLTSDGTPVNGSEQNEYGLMTAYTCLGLSDQAYIMRANIDLDSLSGSTTPPTQDAANGTIWLNTSKSSWGLLQWSAASQDFSTIKSTNTSGNAKLWIIDSSDETDGDTSATYGSYYKPSATIGKTGDYAIVTVNSSDLVWYMGYAGVWNLVGSDSWQSSLPTATGNVTVNTTSSISGIVTINGSNVTLTNANLSTIVSDINAAAIAGVGAYANGSRLSLTANALAANSAIVLGATTNAAIGIPAATYYAPAYTASTFTNVPEWLTTDAYPAPTGSVWYNLSNKNDGANIVIETFNSTSNVWTLDTVTVAKNDAAAIYALDPDNGGANISNGAFYLETGTYANVCSSILYEWDDAGNASITGTIANPTLANGTNTLTINAYAPGYSDFLGNSVVSFQGPSVANLVTAINTLGISGLTAGITSSGYTYIENTYGSTFYLYDGTNTPLAACGMDLTSIYHKVSNWVAPTYVQGNTTPTSEPTDGSIWYYDDETVADILINTGTAWASYRTVSSDARGFDLTATDIAGPIASASTPTTQSNGNALVAGDLWMNTSDLASLPSIYRYDGSAWSQITNSDHTSTSGIVFADARWSAYGNVDPGASTLPAISEMLVASPIVLDSDAPSYASYPRGTLLFNTRRSGMNVKKFTDNAISDGDYTNTWVSDSGNDESGIAYLGSAAQRRLVVKAMIAALEDSEELQDEYYDFNLMCCPGYPEVLSTMVTINEDRSYSAFIVTDTPMTLAPDTQTLADWAGNTNDATTDGINGLVTNSAYAGIYYPAGLTTDLSGNDIIVPASHMALPTIISSDASSYVWFAPAGPSRGLVTSVSSVGYIDAQTGDYITNSISKSLQDVLYPLNVNSVVNSKTYGIEINGQKTLYGQSTALDRINVARLVIYMKKKLDSIGAAYLFEQNDATTRKNLAYQITEFLATLVTDRAISDYVVECDADNNLTATIDANELIADVGVVPLKSAEFVYINLNLDSTISTS
jgi:hypothetical protein